MELKTKYQYSYFIHPFVIDEKKYDQYLLKLLKDKHCDLKLFEKGKDLDIYTYFLPTVRQYMFASFDWDKEKVKQLNEFDDHTKAVLLSKLPCTIFEYHLGKDVQGKVGEKNGIFFSVTKIEIICFQTGIGFITMKTNLEQEDTFSDVLNFNYKFRDINSDFISLKDYENIRLQTSSFKDIKDLSTIIKKITGSNKDAKQMNLEDERFLTYAYACIDQEQWNEANTFENMQGEFLKFAHILPSHTQVNLEVNAEEVIPFQSLKYAKVGVTKQGTVLLTSTIHTQNYTKVPYAFEREYLYTYILALYKKLYLKKVNLDLKRKKDFENTRTQFIDFTQSIWIQEVTNDIGGSQLYRTWRQTLELDTLYLEMKNKYDVIYKDLNIEKNRKITYVIAIVLFCILGFNIINFILLYMRK